MRFPVRSRCIRPRSCCRPVRCVVSCSPRPRLCVQLPGAFNWSRVPAPVSLDLRAPSSPTGCCTCVGGCVDVSPTFVVRWVAFCLYPTHFKSGPPGARFSFCLCSTYSAGLRSRCLLLHLATLHRLYARPGKVPVYPHGEIGRACSAGVASPFLRRRFFFPVSPLGSHQTTYLPWIRDYTRRDRRRGRPMANFVGQCRLRVRVFTLLIVSLYGCVF